MAWETYPQEQLKLIDKIITEQLSQSDQKKFADNLKKADDAYSRKEYPTALFYYEKAKEINETDHITARLKEITTNLMGLETKKIEDAYQECIKKGDEAMSQKNSAIARFYFQKATILKPEEKYPKDKIKAIDSAVVNP